MWININRTGQLGNRLFSRAHVYAAALEFQETVVDWGLLDVARFFPQASKTTIPVYPLLANGEPPPLPEKPWLTPAALSLLHKIRPRMTGTLGPFWNQYYGKKNPDEMRLDSAEFRKFQEHHDPVIINGFKLRCVDWVKKHKLEICKYFAPPASLREKWALLHSSLRRSHSEVIGVHMRGKDFRTAAGGRYYLAPQEYASVLQKLDFDAGEILFILFSDERYGSDYQFSELKSAFHGFEFILNRGDILDDLCGLMACDRIIGPLSSTFSRWAAFATDRPWLGINQEFLTCDGRPEFKKAVIPWDY